VTRRDEIRRYATQRPHRLQGPDRYRVGARRKSRGGARSCTTRGPPPSGGVSSGTPSSARSPHLLRRRSSIGSRRYAAPQGSRKPRRELLASTGRRKRCRVECNWRACRADRRRARDGRERLAVPRDAWIFVSQRGRTTVRAVEVPRRVPSTRPALIRPGPRR
jgi:hypothetical protein